ncbi:chorismate synthase [Oenococcus sp. UCMA 16435]|nr:chorismate synthase [Oenococcus sp. UCMA 16435]MDI4584402.1 chorismate synthase [Oenococcus sp. UCMA 14587]
MIYLTAGESHGKELSGIIEGIPAGLKLSIEEINAKLHMRQEGYGRGNRQKIEKDEVFITAGVRHGLTLGSPISLTIKNYDHNNWLKIMDPFGISDDDNLLRQVKFPRPGHADLVGGMKYRHRDLRNVLERSSARETAMRVAIGAVCIQLLQQLDIQIIGYVRQIGPINLDMNNYLSANEINELVVKNDLRAIDSENVDAVHKLIDQTKRDGDTLGGIVRVVADNLPAGLGSYTSYDEKLDAKLSSAVMEVNAFKGVEIGDAFANSAKTGKEVMDQIFWNEEQGWYRNTDHLGGFEGGMTNGMPIIINAAMKPIPTQYKPLHSVDVDEKTENHANVERSDVTAITAASLVIESVVAIELAKVLLDTFDSSSFTRLKEQLYRYREEIKEY